MRVLFIGVILLFLSCQLEKLDQVNSGMKQEWILFPNIKIDSSLIKNMTIKDTLPILTMCDWREFHSLFFGDMLPSTIMICQKTPPIYPDLEVIIAGKTKEFRVQNPQANYFLSYYESPDIIKYTNFSANIKVDASQQMQTNDGFPAHPVSIQNLETVPIIIGDEHSLSLNIEAKDKHGQWKTIARDPLLRCGNGVAKVMLPPHHSAISAIPIYQGSFQTQMRVALKGNYSNIFIGWISEEQFKSRNPYKVQKKN